MPRQNPMISSTVDGQKTPRAALQKRQLAVHLPQLPLDLWRRRDDIRLIGAFGITATTSNAERIICVNDKAFQGGVRVGMSLTDATAVWPDILTEPRHIERERRLLSALQRWADKYSPRVGIDKMEGLALDITGCAHLFGGEKALAKSMLSGLEDLSIQAQIGIANTRRAARGFSRFGGRKITISCPET